MDISTIIFIVVILLIFYRYYLHEFYIGDIDIISKKPIYASKKIAICISGQFRDIDICMRNHNILKDLNADIFIYADNNLNDHDKEKIINYYNPVKCIWDKNKIPSISPYNYSMVRMFNRIYMCDILRRNYEDINGKYDVVIRTRPDLIFPSYIPTEYIDNLDPNSIYIPNQKFNNTLNQLNDQFAIGNSDTMTKYANFYEYMKNNYTSKSSCTGEKILYNYIVDTNICNIIEINFYPVVYSLRINNNPINYIKKMGTKDFVTNPSSLYNCYIRNS